MVKATSAGLSNCYVPAVTAATPSPPAFTINQLLQQRSSGDGGLNDAAATFTDKAPSSSSSTAPRGPLALRRIVLETSVLSQAAGSALVEWGHTKVLCQVHGPVSSSETSSFQQHDMEEGVLQCDVKLAPNVGMGVERMAATQVISLDQFHATTALSSGKQSSLASTRETLLSSQLYTAISAAVPLEAYPKCHITVHVLVLQDDGNLLSACITAASLALADACMEMNDLVTCCRVALLQEPSQHAKREKNNQADSSWILLADPDQLEEDASSAMITLCLLPNWKQITLWEQSGRMSPQQLQQAMDLCRDGCRTLHRLMRTSLITSSAEIL